MGKSIVMSCINILVLLIVLTLSSLSIYKVIRTALRYKEYYAFAYIPLIVMSNYFFSFAIKSVLCSLTQLFIPLKYFQENSSTYLAKTINAETTLYPDVFVQIPIYKEPFDEVTRPTLESLERAVRKYEGFAAICVCDDGLKIVDRDEYKKRMMYYFDRELLYVARPVENRIGNFKKASNLNYVYESGIMPLKDDSIIFLVDADTMVPEDCINDTIKYFLEDKALTYVQHGMSAFPEQQRNFWEYMINNFTNKIYNHGLMYGTALGDPAPIVGHNVFIKWQTIKEHGFWDPNKVSEDFDMYINICVNGQYGKYAMLNSKGFQEGISLSYVDEVKKLRKFGFGAYEIVFRPISQWFRNGVFDKTFVRYIWSSKVPFSWKASTLYYLATFYAFSVAFYFVLLEAIVTLIDPYFFERYMLRSIDIILSCIICFIIIPLPCEFVFRCRMKKKLSWKYTAKQLALCIPYGLFLTSTMFHITLTSLCYFFGIKQRWGATVKDNQQRSIIEMFKTYFAMYIILGPITVTYTVLAVLFKVSIYRAWGLLFYGFVHMLAPLCFMLMATLPS